MLFFSSRIDLICFVIQGRPLLLQVNVSCGIENRDYKTSNIVNQTDALFNKIIVSKLMVED